MQKKTATEYITELEPLRKKNDQLEQKLAAVNEKFVESVEKRKQLKDTNRSLDDELVTA